MVTLMSVFMTRKWTRQRDPLTSTANSKAAGFAKTVDTTQWGITATSADQDTIGESELSTQHSGE